MLLRIVLATLALAAAGLGVALSLSLTPSTAILRSIPVWEPRGTLVPSTLEEAPQTARPADGAKKSPHASRRDLV